MNRSILASNQQVLRRYIGYLDTLQAQTACRGVGDHPVYQNGIGAFRHIDSRYRHECMQPEEFTLLKGLYTPLVALLNALFFGRVNQCGFIIDKNQEESFARMMVRLHLLKHVKFWLIDGSKFKQGKVKIQDFCTIIDLRGYPLNTVRKLLRWKKEYSPGFDGLIVHDRVDQLIDKVVVPRDNIVRLSSSTRHGEPVITDTLKWNLFFTKDQQQLFSQNQQNQFARCQDDYRKWCLFSRKFGHSELRSLRLYGKLTDSLVDQIKPYYSIFYYPNEKVSFIIPRNKTNNKMTCINDDLDRQLMLKLFNILNAPKSE